MSSTQNLFSVLIVHVSKPLIIETCELALDKGDHLGEIGDVFVLDDVMLNLVGQNHQEKPT